MQIQFDRPDLHAREQLFKKHLKPMKIAASKPKVRVHTMTSDHHRVCRPVTYSAASGATLCTT
jgi:hypothetical protein